MKLWDVWIYEEQDLAHPLLPPDEAQAAEQPEPGETAEVVASRVIQEELALVLTDLGEPAHWAVAIREHGSSQPFRVFKGSAVLTLAVELRHVSEVPTDWAEGED